MFLTVSYADTTTEQLAHHATPRTHGQRRPAASTQAHSTLPRPAAPAMHPAAPPHTASKTTQLPFGSSQRSPTANCRRNRAGTCAAQAITTIQEEQRSRSVLGVQPGEPHGSLRQQERPLQDFSSRTSFSVSGTSPGTCAPTIRIGFSFLLPPSPKPPAVTPTAETAAHSEAANPPSCRPPSPIPK